MLIIIGFEIAHWGSNLYTTVQKFLTLKAKLKLKVKKLVCHSKSYEHDYEQSLKRNWQ